MSITLDRSHLKGFIEDKDIEAILPDIKKAHMDLIKKTGKGRDFTGWVDLPSRVEDKFIKDLTKFAKDIQRSSDCVVSIGIGGSYLGIRATMEFLGGGKLPIYYAGHNLNADYLDNLLESLKNKRTTVIVISKSGTTTEPAIAFRVVKKFMAKKYSEAQLKKRIICVTDERKGALRQIADKTGYPAFVIPDDVGGRFSVLTPVGLVPLAIAGVDIQSLVEGAREGQKEYGQVEPKLNSAYEYAACRYLLYKKGKTIEILSSFYDNLLYVAEWWKQLFGESEGKDGQGIFPASTVMTTDLHSMGQLLQDGVRNLFETFLIIDKQKRKVIVPSEKGDIDGFNCVAGKDIDFVNKKAYEATAMAHFEGNVPNMTLSLAQADAFHLGQLYYFFEKAVAISGYLLGVNPFDQPGVEAYKKKMFALLDKN